MYIYVSLCLRATKCILVNMMAAIKVEGHLPTMHSARAFSPHFSGAMPTQEELAATERRRLLALADVEVITLQLQLADARREAIRAAAPDTPQAAGTDDQSLQPATAAAAPVAQPGAPPAATAVTAVPVVPQPHIPVIRPDPPPIPSSVPNRWGGKGVGRDRCTKCNMVNPGRSGWNCPMFGTKDQCMKCSEFPLTTLTINAHIRISGLYKERVWDGWVKAGLEVTLFQINNKVKVPCTEVRLAAVLNRKFPPVLETSGQRGATLTRYNVISFDTTMQR